MVFYEGGPTSAPLGEYHCTFGRWGWIGRALRDAERLVVSKLWATFVTLLTTGIFGALFFAGKIGSGEGNLGVALSVILGGLVGMAVGIGIVALIQWLPWSRRLHWRPEHEIFTLGGAIGVHVKSLHWHTVRNLRCEITAPNGETATYPAAFGERPEQVLAPGHNSAILMLPDSGTGQYRMKWLIDVPEGVNPVVIARDRYVGPPVVVRS